MPDDVNTIEDLVKHSIEKDYNKANEIFGTVMTTKLNDILDQAKSRIAGQIYNDEDPDPEEPLEDEDFEEIEDEEETEEGEETGDSEEIEDEEEETEEDDDEEEEEVQGAAV